jgi:DNA-binding NtrC family response regulator
VREFQNVMHRAMLQCDGDTILLEHLPSEWRASLRPVPMHANASVNTNVSANAVVVPAAPPVPNIEPVAGAQAAAPSAVIPLAELERQSILRALEASGGHVGRAAQMLGMGRATLYRKLAEISGGGRSS